MRIKVFGRNEENRMPTKVSMEDSSKWNTMKDRFAVAKAAATNKKIKSSSVGGGGGGAGDHHQQSSPSSSPRSVLQYHQNQNQNQNHQQRCRRTNENAWTIDRNVNLRRNESGELGCYVENGRVIYTWGRQPIWLIFHYYYYYYFEVQNIVKKNAVEESQLKKKNMKNLLLTVFNISVFGIIRFPRST